MGGAQRLWRRGKHGAVAIQQAALRTFSTDHKCYNMAGGHAYECQATQSHISQ